VNYRENGVVKKDPRLIVTKAPSDSSANEAVPAEGGFLLQPTFSTEIYQIMHDTGKLFKKCTRLSLGPNSNSISIPAVDEQSRVDGSRYGGVLVYNVDEAGTVTITKPKLRMVNLKLKKKMGIAYVTDELMEDAPAYSPLLMKAFGEEFGFAVDTDIVRGTGAGGGKGILNSPALITQTAVSGQGASTIIWENVDSMWNDLIDTSRPKAEWYINQDCEPVLDQMFLQTGFTGVPIWLPAGQAFGTGMSAPMLKGRPITTIEQCSALGTVGDIILADLSQYVVVDKGGMNSATDISVRFLYDERVFRFIYRFDGAPLWNTPLTPYLGTATHSPFVALSSSRT